MNPRREIKLIMYYKGYLIITANIKQILGMKTYNKTEGMLSISSLHCIISLHFLPMQFLVQLSHLMPMWLLQLLPFRSSLPFPSWF